MGEREGFGGSLVQVPQSPCGRKRRPQNDAGAQAIIEKPSLSRAGHVPLHHRAATGQAYYSSILPSLCQCQFAGSGHPLVSRFFLIHIASRSGCRCFFVYRQHLGPAVIQRGCVVIILTICRRTIKNMVYTKETNHSIVPATLRARHGTLMPQLPAL